MKNKNKTDRNNNKKEKNNIGKRRRNSIKGRGLSIMRTHDQTDENTKRPQRKYRGNTKKIRRDMNPQEMKGANRGIYRYPSFLPSHLLISTFILPSLSSCLLFFFLFFLLVYCLICFISPVSPLAAGEILRIILLMFVVQFFF